MSRKSSVALGPFSRSRDISIVHNEFHGLQLSDDLIERLSCFLREQREIHSETQANTERDENLQSLLVQALRNRDAVAVARLLKTISDHSALGHSGCEAAVLLGDPDLMHQCASRLDGLSARFWKARIELLSGRPANTIRIILEDLEGLCAAGLGAATFRGLANALSDLGFWSSSVRICVMLLNTVAVKKNEQMKVKVLTDLLRSRCRASQDVYEVADKIQEIVLREVNEWQEQIYSFELKKWALIWKIEGRQGTGFIDSSSELARLKNINKRNGNRFSPLILDTIEGLGLICGGLPDIAHEKFGSVVRSALRQPYCSYLAFEGVRLAKMYINSECPLVLQNYDILKNWTTQKQEIAEFMEGGQELRKVEEQLLKMSEGVL